MNPPPLPPTEQSRKTYFHQAATASLAAPLGAVLANTLWRIAHQGEAYNQGSSLIVAILAMLLIAAGLAFGVVALSGISRHGKPGLLGRGVAGVLINGVLILAMAGGALAAIGRKAQDRRQAMNEVDSASRDFRENLGKNYDPETGITNNAAGQLDKYKTKLDSAAKKTTGNDALVLQALSAYMGRIQAETKKYSTASERLIQAEVANLTTLNEKSEIAQRREVVRDFLAANQVFKNVLAKQDEIMKQELQARDLAAAKVDEFMNNFRSSQAPILRKVMAIRAADDKLGQAFIKILDIVEEQWGHFRHSESTGTTVFQDDASADTFNALVAEVQQAGQDQVRLQGELIKLQKLQAAARK